MKRPTQILTGLMSVAIIAPLIYVAGWVSGQAGQALNPVGEAQAAGGKVQSPTSTAPDRYAYYPGTEELAKDEMRVIACGTGMPAARHKQAATCWLVELGNGDKFLFDIGTGSMANAHAEAFAAIPGIKIIAAVETVAGLLRSGAPSAPNTATRLGPKPSSVSARRLVIRWTCGLPGSS